MRTLKKTLALVLAVVMCFGMFAISANAANFTDTVGNKYEGQIDLMNNLGAISGMGNGIFEPNGTLTRAQACTIAAYIALGATNAKLISNASNQVFKDVTTKHWAAGYIEYCYNMKYVNGYGDGNFGPEDKLSTAAFQLILLQVLGYKAAHEDIGGDSWAVATATLAVNAKINVSGIVLSATQNCTRAEACAMAVKMLDGKTVSYTGGTTTIINGVTITSGATRTVSAEETGLIKFYPTVKKTAETVDTFGRPADVYKIGAKVVGTITKTATLTYTTAVTEKQVFADLGLTTALTASNVTKQVDGATSAAQTLVYNGGAITDSGNGVLTEVYFDAAAGTVKFVFINYYFDTVASVTPATSVTKEYVTLTTGATDKTFVISGLKAKDTVIVTKTADKVISVQKVAATAVTPTSFTDKSFTAGGVTYKYNKNNATPISDFTPVNIFLDNYGYVIGTSAVAAVPNYAVFLSSTTVTNWPAAPTISVQAVLADGTVKVFENVNSIEVKSDGPDKNLKAGDIFTYANGIGKDAGKIVLIAKADYAVDSSPKPITKGAVAYDGANKGNAKTIFVVEVDNAVTGTPTYAAYTGIANVPSMTSYTGTTKYDAATDGYQDIVYIYKAVLTAAPTVADTVAYVDASSAVQYNDVTIGEYTVYNAVVDGTITTIKTTKNLITADGIYGKLSSNAKGLVSDVTALSGTGIALSTTPKTGTTAAADGVVKFESTELTYTDSTTVYMVSATGITASSIGAIRLDPNDTVIYYTTNGVLTAVYITVVA